MAIAEGLAATSSLKPLYDLAREMRDASDPEKLRVAASQMLDLALPAREQLASLREQRKGSSCAIPDEDLVFFKDKREPPPNWSVFAASLNSPKR